MNIEGSYSSLIIYFTYWFNKLYPVGVVFKAMDCDSVISEFEIQSFYNDEFRTNTLGMPLIFYVK